MGLYLRTACFHMPTFTSHPLCFISFPTPVTSPWDGLAFRHFRGRPLWGGRPTHTGQLRAPFHGGKIQAGGQWGSCPWLCLGSCCSPLSNRLSSHPREATKRCWAQGFWVWVLFLQFLQMLSVQLPLTPRWRWVSRFPKPPQGLGLLPPCWRPTLCSCHFPFLPSFPPPHLWATSLCFSVSDFFPRLFPSSGFVLLLSGSESHCLYCVLRLWLEWQDRGRGSRCWPSCISFNLWGQQNYTLSFTPFLM